jgi:predicted CXXCH cytochrome family protein
LGGAIYFLRHRSSVPPDSEPFPATIANAGYVDPALCAGCHAKIWETYRRTGMGRSFYRPALSNTLGDGQKPVTFHHKASDSYFTMLERDGRYYQRRYQVGFDGKETNVMEKEIHFVLGSGNHVRAYLHRTSRNTLVELPVAWYAESGGSWAMNPGYDRPDHAGFRRNVNYSCVFCHNGIPEIPPASGDPGAEPVFSGRIPEGIDCQRCHGPGSRHVQTAGTAGAKPEDIRKAIVNPARLSSERAMEVCMQCHLETTSARLPNSIVRYERGPFSYKPGEPLGDFMLQFDHAPGSGHDDKFEIAGAAYRLRRSACFQKSAGALSCTTCHNPHDIPRGQEAALHYTQVCRQCHGAAFNQLVTAGRHPQSADCTSCHMPKRRTDDVVHVVMTDHYIQRRKPARDLLQPLAEKRETDDNQYRGEVVLYYPRELPKAPESELYLALAQVSQNSNLSPGTSKLSAAIEKYRPGRIEYYLQLGDALGAAGQADKALPFYEEAVRRQPNSFAALRKLGTGLRSAGQLARSAEILKRALQAAPADAAAWHELGLDLLNLGSKPDAIAAFEKAIEMDAEMPEVYNSLGGVRLESGDLPRAETAFREAIRIQPDYAEAHSNLGNVLSAAGRFPEARYHFEAAIRLNPTYAARYNFGIALARANRLDEAQREVEAALKINPGVAEAHDLLGNLLVARDKVGPAIDQFREAIRIRPDFVRAHLDLGAALAASGDAAGALLYLRKAAESPDPAVRQEALQILQQVEKGR